MLRLLGGNDFIYVKFNDAIKTITDLKQKIDDKSLENVQKNKEFSTIDKHATLQLIYCHQQLQQEHKLHEVIQKGQSAN